MKQLSQFAIMGGPPVFTTPLVVGRPTTPDRESLHRRIDEMLDSGQFTNNGQLLQQFETQIAKVTHTRHAICVCNGTMAIQLLSKATELSGEVIVPSMTFIATPHALEWIGLTPVFADTDPESHTLDPASVERCITPQTSAILAVHLWGNPCHIKALKQIADRHNLKLLFDASHAFGCEYQGTPIGGFGDAETFSFHATKAMHSIEGGAIVTNDDHIADQCRLMRNFGITGLTQIESPGINAKLSELSAAIGLTSLETFDSVMTHNQQRMHNYREALHHIPGLDLVIPNVADQRNAQYVVCRVRESEFGMHRDQLLDVLRAEGVFARSYFSPGCHRAVPYANGSQHTPTALPVTELLLTEVLQLPTGSTISADDVRQIGDLLTTIQRQSGELCGHLNSERCLTTPVSDAA